MEEKTVISPKADKLIINTERVHVHEVVKETHLGCLACFLMTIMATLLAIALSLACGVDLGHPEADGATWEDHIIPGGLVLLNVLCIASFFNSFVRRRR